MELIADILMAAGAIGAGVYCFVLGQRLKRFNNLENGVGGAVAVLSSQVEDLKKTLEAAQVTAAASAETLGDLTARAEDISKRLELQMAAMHDLPEAPRADDDTPKPARPQAVPTEASQSPAEPMFIRHVAGAGR